MTLSRKCFMEFTGLGLSAVVLAACAPKEVQTAVATMVSLTEPVVPRNTETPSAVPNATATQTIKPPPTPSATKIKEISVSQMYNTELPGSVKEMRTRSVEFGVTPDPYSDSRNFRRVVEDKMREIIELKKPATYKIAGLTGNAGVIGFSAKLGTVPATQESNIPLMVTPQGDPVIFPSVGLRDGNIQMAVILGLGTEDKYNVDKTLTNLSARKPVWILAGPDSIKACQTEKAKVLVENGLHLRNMNMTDPANYTATGPGFIMFG